MSMCVNVSVFVPLSVCECLCVSMFVNLYVCALVCVSITEVFP